VKAGDCKRCEYITGFSLYRPHRSMSTRSTGDNSTNHSHSFFMLAMSVPSASATPRGKSHITTQADTF
jgi:hypothetical protein